MPDNQTTPAALPAPREAPGYERRVTEGPRKDWDEGPDLSTEGWERDPTVGQNGWERHDYHETITWRRPIVAPAPREATTPEGANLAREVQRAAEAMQAAATNHDRARVRTERHAFNIALDRLAALTTPSGAPPEGAEGLTPDALALKTCIREAVDASFAAGTTRRLPENDPYRIEQMEAATTAGRALFAAGDTLTARVRALEEEKGRIATQSVEHYLAWREAGSWRRHEDDR